MSWMYDDYLMKHRTNVAKAYDYLLTNISLVSENPRSLLGKFYAGEIHDWSKNAVEEYDAYDEYFYGNNRSFKTKQAFDKAWLHHIHNNPHHWQHWILIEDDPKADTVGRRALEMPYLCVVEMICDWWSFSWETGDLSMVFDWYDEHKEHMILHTKTRALVEDILAALRKDLDAKKEKENEQG